MVGPWISSRVSSLDGSCTHGGVLKSLLKEVFVVMPGLKTLGMWGFIDSSERTRIQDRVEMGDKEVRGVLEVRNTKHAYIV